MNHIADANKMVSDTPRTDAEYERLFEIYQNAVRINGPLCCAFENDMRLCRQLERELNAANERIDLLTACNADVARIAKERDDALERIKRLKEAGDALKASGYFGGFGDAVNKWIRVKEDKP